MTKSPPNYRYILIRLLDKVRRNQHHYLAVASLQESKAGRRDLSHEDVARARARADSLHRIADDMQFLYDRATQYLTEDDLADIVDFNKQEIHDRSHSLPKSA